jgi:hypothetical protein
MSALWHDIDYIPSKHIHTPTVEKQLADQPLPSEEHKLPKGEQAFQKMDEVYAIAGEQMERGIEGQKFLHGRRSDQVTDAQADQRLAAEDQTRTLLAPRAVEKTAESRAIQEHRVEMHQDKQSKAAGNTPLKTSNAVEASNAKDVAKRAEAALKMAEGLGVSLGAMAVSQALDVTGSSGVVATEAANVVKAVGTAKTAVGMTTPMKETDEVGRPRPGITKKGK